jgi:Uma2 family endonuclease
MTAAVRSRTPLESGDRLTRAEFHRRYCERPDIKKAELVEGVVYVASPVRYQMHGKQHGMVVGWLFTYQARTAGVRLADNATVELDDVNEVQPDAFLFYDPPREGGARITSRGYIEGAPQLVVEVSASSASYDMHGKMEAYRRNGVLEYVVWLVYERRILWLRLRDDAYVEVKPDERGLIESEAFPGLRLAVEAMLNEDAAGVLAALDPGR